MSRIISLLQVAALAGVALLATPAHAIEVRLAPDDYVYLVQDNPRLLIANVQIQNIAIVNTRYLPVTVDEVVIEVWSGNELVATQRSAGSELSKTWASLKSYLDLPGVTESEDPRFRFREILGPDPHLSAGTTLEPQAAIYLARRYQILHATFEMVDGRPRFRWPDRMRVTAFGTDADGERLSASKDLQIIDYQPKNDYVLPVEGRWYVASSPSIRSHHRALPVHEFALDLTQIEDGDTYEGDGTQLTDYFAYGEAVHSMGDGVVVTVYDGMPETRMRRVDESAEQYREDVIVPLASGGYRTMGGNQIVIKHPGGEYSSYAHLRSGSIRVKEGDPVTQGQQIAEVGLSGDGYQPHLHFQLTDGPDITYARGIPMIFSNVQPVIFSSTIDLNGRRQLQTGEFIDARLPTPADTSPNDC